MPLPTPPLYDLTHIRQLVRNDEAVVHRLARIFIQTVPPLLQTLAAALARRDWPALSDAAHHLKSSLDGLVVQQVQQPIRDLEHCHRVALTPAQAARAVALVQSVTNQVVTGLQAEFPA